MTTHELSRERILEMDGPELGAPLIEHVVGDCCIDDGFGSTWAKYGIEDGLPVRFEVVRPGKVQSHEWRPWESISDAWEVVEKMANEDDLGLTFQVVPQLDDSDPTVYQMQVGVSDWVVADTMPLAICRAALLAVIDDTPNRKDDQ